MQVRRKSACSPTFCVGFISDLVSQTRRRRISECGLVASLRRQLFVKEEGAACNLDLQSVSLCWNTVFTIVSLPLPLGNVVKMFQPNR